jgi:hypothetical protein
MSTSRLQSEPASLLSKIPEQGDITSRGPGKTAFLPYGTEQPLYFPLLEGRVIRLIELIPGAWNDPVSIRLFVTELEHAPEYDAISYVWGDPSKTVPITCNGRKLNVTPNLNAAFKRIRLTYRPRIVWADAVCASRSREMVETLTTVKVCINQQHTAERSHHVAFMGEIYRYAKKVLVCMGRDTDGGAEDVASLVHEISEMISGYKSILDMPALGASDPLYDDPRWRAVATLHRVPWFKRAWVIQEVGIAQNPRVLYGPVEFSYRDLMKLALWTMRCAPNLDTKSGVSFFSVHTGWMDWSDNWRDAASDPGEDFVDLLNQARGLSCRDPRDHIYSLLGHPLARAESGSESALIIDPDYNKDPMDVWFNLAVILLTKHGIRVLSSVEHNEDNFKKDYPSWIPWCWPEEYVSCTLGCYHGFYYVADGGISVAPSGQQLAVDEERQLHVQGIGFDSVKTVFAFTPDDLSASPAELVSLAASTSPTIHPQRHALRAIWLHVQKLADSSGTIYGLDWLDAFSLTLIAGITVYHSAEKDIAQHRRDFAAYFLLWLQGIFKPSLSEFETINSTLTSWKRERDGDETGKADQVADCRDGDAEKFYVDMKLMCDGRSFFFTEKGYFGLGSWITRPKDRVCVLFGAKCPVLLREWSDGHQTVQRYKLVQEAYVHKLMRGEAIKRFKKGECYEEGFVIC